MHDTDGPTFLVGDGHPTPTARKAKDFAAGTAGQLKVSTLAGYAPDLNPDKWVWRSVKADRVGRAGVTGKDDLKAKAVAALRRLQRLPRFLRRPQPRLRLTRPVPPHQNESTY